MKNAVSFGVIFTPKFSKTKNGTAPLYARITVNGERTELSLKRRITLSLWNEKRSRLKGYSEESLQVNKSLDRIFNKIYESFRQLQEENKHISAKSIKARYLGLDESYKTLVELLTYHNTKMTSVLKPGTMKNYYTTEKYVLEFLGVKMKTKDVYLKQLNYRFITDFEHFLRDYIPKTHRRRPTNNGVMKHLERLKKLTNLALKMEWIEKDPFARYSLHFKNKERDYLLKREIEALENLDIERETLLRTRDIFIFSCYSGLSYGDAKSLERRHIVKGIDGNKWIVKEREKTGKLFKVPILPKVKVILKKYRRESEVSGFLLPVYSNQKINQYLKELAKHSKISKKLTFHVARHTFATTVTLSNGIPIETVSKLLGHSKLSTTQIYARVVDSKISKEMELLKDKL
ncbi:site-specific integrase [Zunongwangia endophytica]|uniref:Site-specific integrase n=1 Tax=Zunongwangia endophytica TaxID=1808945 RepID=A0ABV8HCD2_9FLAO|nr:site-specific integrase [Zunongwangia endophytica]MDN3593431.1 site-specific integrase [Zunongwangia endophytica]